MRILKEFALVIIGLPIYLVTKAIPGLGSTTLGMALKSHPFITQSLNVARILPSRTKRYLRSNHIDPNRYLRSNHIDPNSNNDQYDPLQFRTILVEEKANESINTILLVVHEAERTGAPVLGLNLALELKEKNNVLVLILDGKGSLKENFIKANLTCIMSGQVHGRPDEAQRLVDELSSKYRIDYAIVNSIESSLHVLPALARNSIFCINLIHEFSSCYGNKKEVWRNICSSPGDFVFSTALTMDDAILAYPPLANRNLYIIPQGRSDFPHAPHDEKSLQDEAIKVSSLMRPINSRSDLKVILGMGSIHLRKGVDLFIQTASKIMAIDPKGTYRFVWVGKSHDSHHNWGYHGFLMDQIQRSGLKESVHIIDETYALDAIYSEADALLITSRLDPLPNVSIDAMDYGIPVFCFDKTTGIAEYISKVGLGDQCIANYLDPDDLAQKVVRLCQDKTKKELVGDLLKDLLGKFFNMKQYAENLQKIYSSSIKRIDEAVNTLSLTPNSLDIEYYLTPLLQDKFSGKLIERGYIESWENCSDLIRKPRPGFNPLIYQEDRLSIFSYQDPYVDYLNNGSPMGRWANRVLSSEDTMSLNLPPNEEIALHLHIHYPELIQEILEALNHNQIRPDLFISITDIKIRDYCLACLKGYSGEIKHIWVSESYGRDVAPFVDDFLRALPPKYKYIGHLHTKKSPHADFVIGEAWRQFLYKNLLGDKNCSGMADKIISLLNSNEDVGIVFPDDPNPISWGINKDFAISLAQKLGIGNLPENFNFPVGTMFWAKTKALKKSLINLPIKYPPEPLPIDGTELHAIERLLPFIAKLNGYDYATTYVKGVTR